jgi:hypothetical protein
MPRYYLLKVTLGSLDVRLQNITGSHILRETGKYRLQLLEAGYKLTLVEGI